MIEIRCNKRNAKGGKCKKLIGKVNTKDVQFEFKCPSCHNISTFKDGEVK